MLPQPARAAAPAMSTAVTAGRFYLYPESRGGALAGAGRTLAGAPPVEAKAPEPGPLAPAATAIAPAPVAPQPVKAAAPARKLKKRGHR